MDDMVMGHEKGELEEQEKQKREDSTRGSLERKGNWR
jgi:hypothetical protein